MTTPAAYTVAEIADLTSAEMAGKAPRQPFHAPGTPEAERLKNIFNRLAVREEGRALLGFLEEQGVRPVFAQHEGVVAAYMGVSSYIEGRKEILSLPPYSALLIDPANDDALIAAVLPHEAQHVRQHVMGVSEPALWVSAADFAWYTRMYEADADTAIAVHALKDFLAGDSRMTDILLISNKAHLFNTALDAYAEDPRALENGVLKRKVFDAWFEGDEGQKIKDAYDADIVRFRWRQIQQDIFSDHPEIAPPRGRLTVKDIEKLDAAQADGIPYLSLPGFRPLDDPYYRGGFSAENKAGFDELEKIYNGGAPAAASPEARM